MIKIVRFKEIRAMTEKQEQARLDAILAMGEGCVKVLWGKVVERGVGLNYRIHGEHDRMRDPLTVARALVFK